LEAHLALILQAKGNSQKPPATARQRPSSLLYYARVRCTWLWAVLASKLVLPAVSSDWHLSV